MSVSRSQAGVLPPEEAWAAEVATGLRLVLASGADEPQAQREQFITDYLERSLQSVPPARRPAYLDRLSGYFPTGITGAAVPAAAGEAPETPAAVLDLVRAAWERFSPDQRAELMECLVNAGIAAAQPVSAGGGIDGANVGDVKQRLGLAPAESLDGARLGRLSVLQMEFFTKLDQLAWNTWRALAPRSGLKRDNATGDLRSQTRRYLKGDAEPTDLQLAQGIERTRQLIASLLGSMSQIGRGYAQRFQSRYSPEAVKDIVAAEGGGGWGAEGKCWRKYSELAAEVNEATIQNEMQETVVRYVEELMRAMMRGTG